ncbi:hypothetical protein HY346_02305 [Candidatus Microgenomates bacterium]|nr:hypothetical protein [Candidatus Microgenomates bacterium]
MAKKPIGKVTHYYDQAAVAVIALEKGASLKIGDEVSFIGTDTDFSQTVGSLQVDHQAVDSVKAGMDFGMKVEQKVHEHTQVFKV